MLEFLRAATRERRAIAQAEMRAVIEHRDIGFPEQSRDGAERAAKSAVEKHRVFAAEELRDLALQFAMQIGHAGKHRRTAGPETMSSEGLARGGDHFGVIGQPEIIVGAEIDDGLRFAVVGDRGPRVGGGEQFRLVKFDRPRARLHPASESGGRLQRISSFGREEITQTKFGWIVAHKKTAPRDIWRGEN